MEIPVLKFYSRKVEYYYVLLINYKFGYFKHDVNSSKKLLFMIKIIKQLMIHRKASLMLSAKVLSCS